MSRDYLDVVFAYLSKVIVALGPYQTDAVLSGGLVPVVYRSILPAVSTRLNALTTFDIDWTVPVPLEDRGTKLHERLLTDFEAIRTGSGKLPVTKYFPKGLGTDSPIYVEFIAPRQGGKRTKGGVNQGVLEVQSDLLAQTDPYAGMLLLEPWQLGASQIPQLKLTDDHQLLVPHPLCFMQKALIRDNRSSDSKRDNDACHIYDVAILTNQIWPDMRSFAARLNSTHGIPTKWILRAFDTIHTVFESADSSGTIAAVLNYSPATSAHEVISAMDAFQKTCRPA